MPENGITVTGHGEVSGPPDVVTVGIGVSVRRETAAEAIRAAASRAEALIAALSLHRIDRADLRTSHYAVAPEYDHRGERPRRTGYRVENTLAVRIEDVDRSGLILDAATAAVGDDIRIDRITFSADDNGELLSAARTSAWEDALGKARQLAALSGVTLGKPVSIVESHGGPAPPGPRVARMEAMVAATPIEGGQQSIAVDLEVTFAIEP